MGRYLVVANQTLGGRALQREIAARLQRGDASFHVVVPLIHPEDETETWSPDDPELARVRTEEIAEAIDEALRRSRRRLELMMASIRRQGGHVDGEVGDADPAQAAMAVLGRQAIDEVLVSTLPRGLSGWLRVDMPSRLARMTDVPVVVIEADE